MFTNWRSVLLILVSLTLAAQVFFAFLMIVGAIKSRGTTLALPGLGLLIAGPLIFIVPLMIDLVLIVFAGHPFQIVGVADTRQIIKHEDQKSEGVAVRGSTLSMFDINAVNISTGRTWTESEGTAAREVCVVGTDMLENLFGGAAADRVLNQEVRIAGHPFQIVGVAEPFGKIFGLSRDNFIMIPSRRTRNFSARAIPSSFIFKSL